MLDRAEFNSCWSEYLSSFGGTPRSTEKPFSKLQEITWALSAMASFCVVFCFLPHFTAIKSTAEPSILRFTKRTKSKRWKQRKVHRLRWSTWWLRRDWEQKRFFRCLEIWLPLGYSVCLWKRENNVIMTMLSHAHVVFACIAHRRDRTLDILKYRNACCCLWRQSPLPTAVFPPTFSEREDADATSDSRVSAILEAPPWLAA